VTQTPFTVRVRPVADRARFWFWDPSHFPRPVSSAAETVELPAMAAGFAQAATDLRRPLPAQYIRVERGYVYFGVDLPAGPEELARREAESEAALDPLIETALDRWMRAYAPEAERLNAEIRAYAGPALANAALAEGLDAVVALRTRQWAIHDLALVPAMAAAARFTARYGDLLGGAAGAQVLLQGFPNRATEAAEALDAVAQAVRERPDVAEALRHGPAAVLPGGLSPDDAGWLNGMLNRYLESFGDRTRGWDVGEPTWGEDPGPVIALLQQRLRRAPIEPGAQRRTAAEQRDRAVRDATARLPEDERPAFTAALHAAWAYPVISEDHNALIDQAGATAVRAVLLEAGRRLVQAGLLDKVDDAVWLTRQELQSALRGGSAPRRRPALRRGWQRRRMRLTPPRTFGAPLPAWAATNPTLADFFGLGAEAARTAGELRGTGASPGRVTGRAAVIATLDDAGALQPGEVLVCRMTSPAWTPLLALAAGAVVETGGMLSHTAVLAREFGIPCVVNARGATERIPDGATVDVDGTDGVVRWDASAGG
jgi:phosphohistidine swiveling domain-containing protein